MPSPRIGELLLKNKLVTAGQIQDALVRQLSTPQIPLGRILCEMGVLRMDDLERLLDATDKRPKLGDILLRNKQIDEAGLKEAIALSRKERILLGKALLKLQLITEEHLAKAIARQYDLQYMEIAGLNPDPELGRILNANFAQRHEIVPIALDGQNVTIAMAFPLLQNELRQIENFIQLNIVPVIAKESEIRIVQQKVFKIVKTVEDSDVHFELSEDQVRGSTKSKYISDFISADVDYLTKLIIATGVKDGSSDIHLESTENGMIVRYRLDGILWKTNLGTNSALISSNGRQIISKIKILCDMDISERRRPQDSSFKMKVSKEGKVRNVDFRVSTVPTQFGENVVIRILDKQSGATTLKDLGYFPDDVKALYNALDKPTGIFLVTGPTGSGKSSTLYAVLTHINKPGSKTLTIEDPIEYSIDGITQTEVNEVVGNTFARMLRAFLRQDPDNIMVGEIRDIETATISMRAALTGHTVLSTLHTNDATSAVTRLIDMGVEPGLLSTTLRCVLAQRLVRLICPECKVTYSPADKLLEEFGISPGCGMEFVHGKGCPSCHYTGFHGRCPIVELWIPSREELLMINRRPDNHSLRNIVFSAPGRLTMVEDGFRRVQSGQTTIEELLRTVPYEQIEAGREKIAKLLRSPSAKIAPPDNVFKQDKLKQRRR